VAPGCRATTGLSGATMRITPSSITAKRKKK
jgi:hypothetical protein